VGSGGAPRLTETEKAIVRLHQQGLKPKEIAEKLGCSVKTVYKALSKYRKLVSMGISIDLGTQQVVSQQQQIQTTVQTPLQVQIPRIATQDQVLTAVREVMEGMIRVYTTSLTNLLSSLLRDYERTLIDAINELRRSVDRLCSEITSLHSTIQSLSSILSTVSSLKAPAVTSPPAPAVAQIPVKEVEIPEFVRDNPWVEILRTRAKYPQV